MRYRITQSEKSRESHGNYEYSVFKGNRLIAIYWHDYRGDEHGIEFVNGPHNSWPIGRMIDFIEGGGPEPLTLSAKAVAYLDDYVK